MEVIFRTYKKTKSLHHAYLIEGDSKGLEEKLLLFVEQDMGISIQGNPDVWIKTFEKFGIDEGRELRNLQSKKAITDSKRIFVVTSRFFTREAQNALLKVFEEPTEDTHFFIITPHADSLLPTLKSRLFIVTKEEVDAPQDKSEIAQAEEFLSATIEKRLAIVEPIIKEKDKALAMKFIDTLECSLSRKEVALDIGKKEVLNDLISIRGYLYGNAPSVKMICEHLCTTIPRVAEV